MKINQVSVRYGELRSTGYPSYSNKRIEIEVGAVLDTGDIPKDARAKLLEVAKREVAIAFGDVVETDPMGIPF